MKGITKRDVILIIMAVVIGELVRRFIVMAARKQKATRGTPDAAPGVPSAFPAEVGPGLTADMDQFIDVASMDMGSIGDEMQR